MGIRSKGIIAAFIFCDVLLGFYLLLRGKNIALLSPSGLIASQERGVIVIVGLIGLTLVGAVVTLTFFVAWKYRVNGQGSYEPNWDHSVLLEAVRWGFLGGVIGMLAIFTWYAAHAINPWKPISSPKTPITIQVVALQWRWLFIYPEQHIATVNSMVVPINTPVNLELTADAPMNSFWVPNIVGQMYAMTGMSTQNHFMIEKTGTFQGLDAEISGKDFANMKFSVRAVAEKDFNNWVEMVGQSSNTLTVQRYATLAKPNSDTRVQYYTLPHANLYNSIVMKFMQPASQAQDASGKNMSSMGM